jgi:signal transduction histidine kinase
MRPGRLFWKLFLCFWLATTLSFTVLFAIFEYKERNGPESGSWLRTALFMTITSMVEAQGPDAAIPIIRHANRENEQFSFTELTPGEQITTPPEGAAKLLKSPDGRLFLLQSRLPIWQKPNHRLPFAIGTVFSILFSALLAWHLSRPLRRLGAAARAVASGELSTRVGPLMGRRRDEIVDLVLEFDRMVAQLQQTVEAQRRLLHDISHELRSPLTRLQAAIGLLRQSPDEQQAMLARIERESERLDELIEELLTLARLESGQQNLPYEKVDLIELLAAIAEDAGFEAAAKGARVCLASDPAFVSWVSGEMLYRAFENIVRNAVKFTDPGTEVRIEARVIGDNLRLTVGDNGPGVPQDMLESIFEPFKRVEGTGDVPGLGLGLSIALRAVQMHGGQIKAMPGQPRGLVVQVELPRRVG